LSSAYNWEKFLGRRTKDKGAELADPYTKPASHNEKELKSMSIKITTADIAEEYEIIEPVFAFDSSAEKMFSSANPELAFKGVNKELAEHCRRVGGDAVVGCQYEYRNALADGFIGKKQSIEIFCYGTAVKLK